MSSTDASLNLYEDFKKVLITGCSGFIGSKVSEMLIKQGINVIGLDKSKDHALNKWRLSQLQHMPNFTFVLGDINDFNFIKELIKDTKPDVVMNFAARAGVRESVKDPWSYFQTNVIGTINLLEACKQSSVRKFLLSSTSSIYGNNKVPFSEESKSDLQLSPYAASKKSAESISFTYHYLYGIDVIIPRYFTVYGPAGRPDMTPLLFTYKIAEGEPIQVYGNGTQERDFTYIDDIARGTILALRLSGFEIINFGSDRPIQLNYLIQLIEQNLGSKANIQYCPWQLTDATATWADISKARELLGWQPTITIEEGIKRTVDWYIQNRSWLRDNKF